MIGYILKNVLNLVPEALPLVKKAELEQSFPVNSPDNCLASSLVAEYNLRISKQPVDYDILEKVATAVEIFGLTEKKVELSELMVQRHQTALVKQASVETPEKYLEKQAYWEGELTGFKDLEKVAEVAETLLEQSKALGIEPSPLVKTYAIDGYLSKEAALGALGARYHLTSNDVFVKIAAALSRESDFIPGGPLAKSLCKTVSRLDKQAELSARGFDFYKETVLTKSAAMNQSMIKLCGKNVPLIKIAAIPRHHLDSYMGKEFGKELDSDPNYAKAMIEALPRDSQQILMTLVNHA